MRSSNVLFFSGVQSSHLIGGTSHIFLEFLLVKHKWLWKWLIYVDQTVLVISWSVKTTSSVIGLIPATAEISWLRKIVRNCFEHAFSSQIWMFPDLLWVLVCWPDKTKQTINLTEKTSSVATLVHVILSSSLWMFTASLLPALDNALSVNHRVYGPRAPFSFPNTMEGNEISKKYHFWQILQESLFVQKQCPRWSG